MVTQLLMTVGRTWITNTLLNWKCKIAQLTFLIELNIQFPKDAEILVLDINSEKSSSHKMVIAALFVIVKTGNSPDVLQ